MMRMNHKDLEDHGGDNSNDDDVDIYVRRILRSW